MTENQLREKVINGLEYELRHRGKCGHYCREGIETFLCEYDKDGFCIQHWGKDALALLKAQEPRLVEPNDFENADDFNWLPAWCEERIGAGYWEMILPGALDEKDVRYWTGRPTQEQMEATPWQIQS